MYSSFAVKTPPDHEGLKVLEQLTQPVWTSLTSVNKAVSVGDFDYWTMGTAQGSNQTFPLRVGPYV